MPQQVCLLTSIFFACLLQTTQVSAHLTGSASYEQRGIDTESCGAHGVVTNMAALLQSSAQSSHMAMPQALVNVLLGQPAEGETASNDSLIDDFLENKTEGASQNKPGHFPELEEEAEEEEKEHEEGHVVFIFLLIVLLLGIVTTFTLERFLPFLPYTSVLFLEGLLIAFVQPFVANKDFDISIALWERADPHLLMFIFLPPLVFAEAMQLNVTLVKQCFWQCMLLAAPGVILGAVMIGAVGRYLFPYDWDWPTALLFGSILSATDPVAVVAIFNSLGVSPRLTMLVSGESLFNDGTAILLFRFCTKLAAGVALTGREAFSFMLRMVTVGPIFGAILGYSAVWFLGVTASGANYPGDIMCQVVITLFCAYAAFFIAEKELDSSGVLTLVTTGYILASNAWPRFLDRETVHTIWHMIDFVGNTVIFMLAGLIFGGIIINAEIHNILTYHDVFALLALYVCSMAARALMLGVLWVPLQLMGHPVSWGEGCVIVWAGMRGAVGLLMAIIADRNPATSTETGTRIMFQVGGTAALMLIINGPTMPLILKWTGLMRSTKEQEQLFERERFHLSAFTQQQLSMYIKGEDAETKDLFAGAVQESVENMMTLMHVDKTKSEKPEHGFEGKVQLMRGALLRAVKSTYWQMLDNGLLRKKTITSKVLCDSCDLGLMNEAHALSDWDAVASGLQIGKFKSKDEYLQANWSLETCTNMDIVGAWDHARGNFENYQECCIRGALAFIHAHQTAMEEVVNFLGNSGKSPDIEQLEKEDAGQLEKARAVVKGMDDAMVKMVKSKMLAAKLLHDQSVKVNELAENGVITSGNKTQLESEIFKAQREAITRSFTDMEKDIAEASQWFSEAMGYGSHGSHEAHTAERRDSESHHLGHPVGSQEKL